MVPIVPIITTLCCCTFTCMWYVASSQHFSLSEGAASYMYMYRSVLFYLTSDCILIVILSVFHFPLRGLYMCLVATSSLILSNPSPTQGSGSSFVFRAANFHCFFTERPPNFLLPKVYEATCFRGAWPGDLYVGDSWSGMSPSEWALLG